MVLSGVRQVFVARRVKHTPSLVIPAAFEPHQPCELFPCPRHRGESFVSSTAAWRTRPRLGLRRSRILCAAPTIDTARTPSITTTLPEHA